MKLRTPLLWLYAVATIFYGGFIARTSLSIQGTRYFVLFEDAMISMRYARNFARGDGLNWNAGEERVEGYTNLLWTLWMSLLHKVGLPESKISLVVMLSGVAILFGCGWVVRRLAVRVGATEGATLVAVAATLFCYPLVFWTLRGMEVGAVSLVLHCILLLAMELEDDFTFGRLFAMGALGAASVLLRSDSAVSVGLLGLYAAVFAPKGRRALTLLVVGGLAAGTVALHTYFRVHYYHETLPNTAYLKLKNIRLSARLKRGVFVLLQVLAFHLALPLAALIASAVALREDGLRTLLGRIRREKELRRRVLCGVFVTLQLTYAVYVGGDAWEWMLYANRYMSAALPAFLVLAATLIGAVLQEGSQHKDTLERALVTLAVVLVGCMLTLLLLNAYAWRMPEFGIARTIVVSKKAVLGGVIMGAIGVVTWLVKKRAATALSGLHLTLQERPARALPIFFALFLPCHLEPLLYWTTHNAAQFQDEARYTRLGVLLRQTTPKDFRLAVVAAGATPYFADRPTEDMLGKNDKFVAKQAPRGVFSPGHDKWDYQHSLGAQKPDLIVEMADVDAADEAYLASLGFFQLPNELLYRDGGRPYHEALSHAYGTDGELAATLSKVGPIPTSVPRRGPPTSPVPSSTGSAPSP